MAIWTGSLKFNIGRGDIHQLPQTTGGGIHSLLQEVVWDVGYNVPNAVLQLFHCARFCPVHLFLCPATQENLTGCEIWTSCRPFVKLSSSQTICQLLHVMGFPPANVQEFFNTVCTSIGRLIRTSRTASHMTYSCHYNLSRFPFPIFLNSWRFCVFHSSQSIPQLVHITRRQKYNCLI